MRRRAPPWLEGVQLTPELIYEYQIHPRTLNDVLKADLDAMKTFSQPLLVNDQLGQLYLDLEMEGFGTELILEDGITSSGSDSGSSNGSWTESQVRTMIKKTLRNLLRFIGICYITRDMFDLFTAQTEEKNGEVWQVSDDP